MKQEVPPIELGTTARQLFIAGGWRDASDGSVFGVDDPATGTEVASVADAGPDDAMAALDAAAAAARPWAATPARMRSELLRGAFDLLIERREQFARLILLETGKPLAEARDEVTYAAEFLRWFAEEAVRISGRYQPAPDGRSRLLVTKRPVGPCLFITPWNFPLAMVTRKVAPALAAGCTSVLKPSELTPLSALAFAALLVEVGLPSGVVNVIPTTRAAATTGPLLRDRRLRKLSFTGSTAVGQELLVQSAGGVLRTSMELGGNAPFIVFRDADLDVAVAAAVTAKLRNAGQACTAANRFIVHADVADEFGRRLAQSFAALPGRSGSSPAAGVGPLIDQRSRARVEALVQDAVGRGATALTGGSTPEGPGWFYPPTVLTGVPARARVLQEEIFGPVAPIVTFRHEGECVELANDTEAGLVGYLFTPDLSQALRMSEELEVGMLGINQGSVSEPAAPFGGVKASGLGREGGNEGIEEFVETVYVGIGDPYADCPASL